MNPIRCPSCGKAMKDRACACGQKARIVHRHGDLGIQIDLGKRRVRAACVFQDGQLKRT